MAIPRFHYLLAILHFSLILAPISSLFSPPDNLLISCGSSASSILDDHRVFVPDSTPNPSLHLSSSHSIPVSAAGSSPSSLYQTARVFPSLSTYALRTKHHGPHFLRLHFLPFSTPSHNLSSAIFHVAASGLVLLVNAHFNATAGPVVKEYIISVSSDDLVLSFIPACSHSFAFVNAIELFSAPEDLVPDVARLVIPNQDVKMFHGVSKQALETLHRINVGGSKVTPFNDSLWRNWIPDTEFLKPGSPSVDVTFTSRIQYQKGGASREVAPDNVYNTARVLESGDDSDILPNMTWTFNLSPDYQYLIRMHFCDIASKALNELYFSIYINGNYAYKDFDLSAETNLVLASPYYVDFVAGADSSGVLNVSIGATMFTSDNKIRGLLNGLEIMKMNNSMASLDGGVSAGSVLGKQKRGGFGRSVVCGFALMSLLVIAFMLVLRLRDERKNVFAWSPLPTQVSEGKQGKGSSNMVSTKLEYS